MSGDNISANLKADVSISANKSQALPLSLVGLSAISLIAGFIFLWLEPTKCWLPIMLAVVFAGAGGALWWRSHKASELEGGSPTEVVDTQRGVRVLTDSRSLESPVAVQHLAELVTQIAHRCPLPEPDGMVDAQGNPQPNRKQEAVLLVGQANSQASGIVRGVAQILSPEGEALSSPTQGSAHVDPNAVQANLPLGR